MKIKPDVTLAQYKRECRSGKSLLRHYTEEGVCFLLSVVGAAAMLLLYLAAFDPQTLRDWIAQ